MYYGFVGGTIKTVFSDWSKVETLRLIYPYSSYHKFRYEYQAWEWVRRRGSKKITESIVRYGSVFKNHYLRIEYLIGPDSVYYNVYTNKLGYVKLVNSKPDVIIENRSNIILVEIQGIELNKNLIISHLIAIQNILQIVGDLVDVEFILPNHSIFYAMTHYTGSNKMIAKILEFIKKRQGSVAWTLFDFGKDIKEDFNGDI